MYIKKPLPFLLLAHLLSVSETCSLLVPKLKIIKTFDLVSLQY